MLAQMQGPRGQGQKRRQQAEWIMIKSFVPCQSELQVAHLKERDVEIWAAKKSLRAASGLEAFGSLSDFLTGCHAKLVKSNICKKDV